MHKRIICAMLALLSLLICPGFAAKEQATLPPFPDGYSLGSHTPAPTLPEEPEVLGPQQMAAGMLVLFLAFGNGLIGFPPRCRSRQSQLLFGKI